MSHCDAFINAVYKIIGAHMDGTEMEILVSELVALRERRGRLFIVGLGGSAANASHAANDFAKLCSLECYAPSDNVAEMTARMNDEGPETMFTGWLKERRFNSEDAILVLSVGGGAEGVSAPIVAAVMQANEIGAKIYGIVGRDGGVTKKYANACVLIPVIDPNLITPLTESFQSIVLHAIVSHPAIAVAKAKWEGMA